MEAKGYFHKAFFMQTHVGVDFLIFADRSHSSLPGTGQASSSLGNLHLAFRQCGEGRELFLHLLTSNCLHLKIIFMPKRHILGWHILIPFTGFRVGFSI